MKRFREINGRAGTAFCRANLKRIDDSPDSQDMNETPADIIQSMMESSVISDGVPDICPTALHEAFIGRVKTCREYIIYAKRAAQNPFHAVT